MKRLHILAPTLLLSLCAGPGAFAQGITASGTLVGTPDATPGLYDYTLTLKDTGSTTVGSLWYAWVPGTFYLPHTPNSVSPAANWNDSIVGFGNGSSIQFTAGSAANDLTPGQSVSFGFVSQDSPATLQGNFNGGPTGTSVAYANNSLGGSSFTFVVQSVPEPSTWLLMAGGGLGWLGLRRKR